MAYNFVTNIQQCETFVKTVLPINLIYYSHIPVVVIALLLGFYIFFKKRTLESGLLLGLSITFSLWTIFDFFTWTNYSSVLIMFSWSVLGILFVLFFCFALYFVYVFIDKKDIPFKAKIVLAILSLPTVILTPTTLNLSGFNVADCEGIESTYFTYYYYAVGVIIFIWIIALLINRYIKAIGDKKRQILFLGIGIGLCLLAFSWGNIIGSFTLNWPLMQYGLFGMPIFIGFLTYLIVRYNAFDVKLISAQALVIALIILIASQFFFIQNNTNRILTAITLGLSVTFGWWLVRSVKDEIKKKEELMELTEKLSEAYRRMKQLDRAKSEFVSIASHQLRTPLTAIKGFISLLLDGTYGSIPQSPRGVLEKVYLSNERLISLVEDLLNISRIESGRMVFSFKPNDISHLVGDIVENMVFAAKNKNLYLDFKTPQPEIAEFIFDKDKLREVISNMVDNAIKYTKKGGVTVRIREVKNAMGEFVQVIVADTGVGIVKGEEQYIFEKFQRGKDISRVHTEGIGLGLYVANKIIEAHQGKMWAESDGLGRGSRFYLQLRKDFVAPVNAQMQENGKVAVEFSTQDDGKKEPAKTEA